RIAGPTNAPQCCQELAWCGGTATVPCSPSSDKWFLFGRVVVTSPVSDLEDSAGALLPFCCLLLFNRTLHTPWCPIVSLRFTARSPKASYSRQASSTPHPSMLSFPRCR